MYVPDRLDAHNEFTVSNELQTALWKTVRAGDRTINLQHSDRRAGEWVEVVTWPYPVEAELMLPQTDGSVSKRSVSLPAGTPYMGVVWEPWAYDLVKKGHLRGYSMEGAAQRVEVDFDDRPVTVTKAVAVHSQPDLDPEPTGVQTITEIPGDGTQTEIVRQLLACTKAFAEKSQPITVHISAPPTNVSVTPAPVTVTSPDVHVDAHIAAPRAMTKKITRDDDGNMTGVTEVPVDSATD